MKGVSVSYRKVGGRWHIRFQKKGKKEVVESLPGTLYEKTVADRAAWYRQEISLGREDPWSSGQGAGGRMLVVDAIEEYTGENLASGNWSRHTYNTNRSRLTDGLSQLLDRRVHSVTESQAQQALDDLDVRAVTKKGYRSTWNTFFKFCYEQGYTGGQIRVGLSVPDKIELRNEKDIKYLTWRQVADVCGATRFYHRQIGRMYSYREGRGADFYCDLWWFMFYNLLRKEEVPRLRVDDLLPGGRLRVHGKGRRVDIIPLPPPALKIAKSWARGRDPGDRLIVRHMNRPYTHWKRSVRMALGSDHSTGFHQLRHGGVVHYFTLGKPVQFVSKLARHASVQVTLEIYGDVIPDGLAEAFADVGHSPATNSSQKRVKTD